LNVASRTLSFGYTFGYTRRHWLWEALSKED